MPIDPVSGLWFWGSEPSTAHGLEDPQVGSSTSWNPFQWGGGRGGELLSLGILSSLGTMSSFAGSGLDIFDRASEYVSNLTGLSRDNSGMPLIDNPGAWAQRFSETGQTLSDAAQTLQRPTETGGYLSDVEKQVSEGRIGAALGTASTLLQEQGAIMGGAWLTGMGLFGKAEAAAEASTSVVAKGFGAQIFSDTYNQMAADPNNSLIEDVAVSAANAGVQTYLEELGLDTIAGRGAIAALGKAKLGKSRIANSLLGGLISLATESGEEGLQQGVQSAVDAYYGYVGDPKKSVVENWWSDLSSKAPEQMFAGAVVGHVLGSAHWGLTRPGLEHVAQTAGAVSTVARHGGEVNPNNVLSDLASGQTNAERARSQLREMSINQIQDLIDLATDPEVPEESRPGPHVLAELINAQKQVANAADLADLEERKAVEAAVEVEDSQRTELAQKLTPEIVQKLDNSFAVNIQQHSDAAAERVAQLNATWQAMNAVLSGEVQPQVDQEGMNIQAGQFSPEHLSNALSAEAVKLGIELTPEQLSSPNTIDWNRLEQSERAKAESNTRAALADMAGAISDAVDTSEAPTIASIVTAPKVVIQSPEEASLGQIAVSDIGIPSQESDTTVAIPVPSVERTAHRSIESTHSLSGANKAILDERASQREGRLYVASVVQQAFKEGNAQALSGIAVLNELTKGEADDLISGIAPDATPLQRSYLYNYGHEVVTPFSVYWKVRETWGSREEAAGVVATLHAASQNWAAQTGGDLGTFWKRIASEISNTERAADALYPGNAEGIAGYYMKASNFGRSLIRLISTSWSPMVMAHESIHALHYSGLLKEILSPEHLTALEKFVGERLYSKETGAPANVSREGEERLAVGFERFLSHYEAPNEQVRGAFNIGKRFFKAVFDSMANAIYAMGIKPYNDVDVVLALDAVKDGDKPYSLLPKLTWSNTTPTGAAARAFHALITVDPATISAREGMGARGLVAALEAEMEDVMGIPAKGWLTASRNDSYPAGAKSGYSLSDGRAPTVPEWHNMMGLVNPDANGAVMQHSIRQMEGSRELIARVASEVNDPESKPKTRQEQLDEEVKKVVELRNQVVNSALAKGGGMEASMNMESMLAHFAEVVMAGEKDAHYYGRKPDLTEDEKAHKEMVENAGSNLRGFINRSKNEPFGRLLKEFLLRPPTKALLSFSKGIMWGLGNTSEEMEKWARDLGLPVWAEQINNHHAINKFASKAVFEHPKIFDESGNHVDIPGGRKWEDIFGDFTEKLAAFWEGNRNNASTVVYRNAREFHDASMRDLKLWMLGKRQIELADNRAQDEQAHQAAMEAWEANGKQGAKPVIAKGPHVDPVMTQMARAWMSLLEAKWGKEAHNLFERTSLELTKWENMMVLDNLLSAGFIKPAEYKAMLTKGTRHVPFYRIKNALETTGAINPRLDDSLYKPLDYLKLDLSMSVEDPLNSMLRRAQAVKVLTMRQHAKNAIGNRVLDDVQWWDHNQGGFEILHEEREVSKEEWDTNTSPGKFRKVNKKSAVRYFVRDLVGAEEFNQNFRKKLIAQAFSKAKQGENAEKIVDEQISKQIFAFFTPSGETRYMLVTDPDLARSFYYSNNPQAVMADGFVGSIMKKLEGIRNKAESKGHGMAARAAKATMFSLVGWTPVYSKLITHSPRFGYNVPWRDLPQSIQRSRHGLRVRDIPNAFKHSIAELFPSLRIVDPEKYWASTDAAYGTGEFSGMVRNFGSEQGLDADEVSWLTWGRKALIESAQQGSKGAKMKLLGRDYMRMMAEHGVTLSPKELVQKIWAREAGLKDYVMLGKWFSHTPYVVVGAMNNLFENNTRLAERMGSMEVDLSQYPQLLQFYKTDAPWLIGGKPRAGFVSNQHRKAWLKVEEKVRTDPNYIPPQDAMPMQFSATERDYSMAHVTLNFSQKGKWSSDIQSQVPFFNPNAQDFITNMKILADHSYTKRAIAWAMGEENAKLAPNQAKLDARAWGWLYRAVQYVTMPMIISLLWNMAFGGDRDKEEWWATTFIEKMGYTHLVIPGWTKDDGSHRKLRIPNGLGLGTTIFHDLPMAALATWFGNDPHAVRKWARRFFQNTPFGLATEVIAESFNEDMKPDIVSGIRQAGGTVVSNPLWNPLYELAVNHESWRNKQISYDNSYSPVENSQVASERFNVLSNYIARATGAQPAQAAYAIKRYMPGFWAMGPWAANKALEVGLGAVSPSSLEDVAQSTNPLYGGMGSLAPSIFAGPIDAKNVDSVMSAITSSDPWGPQNESVLELKRLTRVAEEQYNTYMNKPLSQQPVYFDSHPLLKLGLYYDLVNTRDKINEYDKIRKETLFDEKMDINLRKFKAYELERTYTLWAVERLKLVYQSLAGGK